MSAKHPTKAAGAKAPTTKDPSKKINPALTGWKPELGKWEQNFPKGYGE